MHGAVPHITLLRVAQHVVARACVGSIATSSSVRFGALRACGERVAARFRGRLDAIWNKDSR